MEVSTRTALDAALRALDPSASQEVLQQRLQASLLKKSLVAQQEQAAEITRMVEGKGSVIDIRV